MKHKIEVILDNKHLNINDLLDDLQNYFNNQNKDFKILGISSMPLVSVDTVKYRVIIGSAGGMVMGCQKIILKEEH